MSKIAVVYWSGTGNTEEMANAVADGAKAAGAEAVLLTSGAFDASMTKSMMRWLLTTVYGSRRVGRRGICAYV